MEVRDFNTYKWNRSIAASNLAKVDPLIAAQWCDILGVPWWSSWPRSGGIKAYCPDDETWHTIISNSKIEVT